MKEKFYEFIEANPIIAAVKNDEDLRQSCLINEIKVIFILYGNICNIKSIVDKVKESGKIAIVHIDLIVGLSSKDIVVDFVKIHANVDGIISTKPSLIKRAKELGLYTVLRVFIIDSISFKNIKSQISSGNPDMIEILPGLMPKVIKEVNEMIKIPIIVGGLIEDKNDILNALSAGAMSISTTNHKIWTI